MSFWDVVWFTLIGFAFVAYLMVLFSIITDLFRDRDASGLTKAAWIVALIFVPVITGLVYLLVRGRGMAERATRNAATMKNQQDAYIREVAGETTPADQISQALKMLNAGAISEAEYDRLKEKALT
jgi:hypothetical protein